MLENVLCWMCLRTEMQFQLEKTGFCYHWRTSPKDLSITRHLNRRVHSKPLKIWIDKVERERQRAGREEDEREQNYSYANKVILMIACLLPRHVLSKRKWVMRWRRNKALERWWVWGLLFTSLWNWVHAKVIIETSPCWQHCSLLLIIAVCVSCLS